MLDYEITEEDLKYLVENCKPTSDVMIRADKIWETMMKPIKNNSLKCPECGKYQSSYVSPDEHTQKITMHCDNCGNEWAVPNPKYTDGIQVKKDTEK